MLIYFLCSLHGPARYVGYIGVFINSMYSTTYWHSVAYARFLGRSNLFFLHLSMSRFTSSGGDLVCPPQDYTIPLAHGVYRPGQRKARESIGIRHGFCSCFG